MEHKLNTRLTFEQLFTEGNKKVKFSDGGENEIDESYLKYYKKEGYIESPEITSKDQLLKSIEENIQPAFDSFMQKHKLPKLKIEVQERKERYSINGESEHIKGKALGLFAEPLEYAGFYLFSGKEISFSEKGRRFFFRPYIWSTLSLGYQIKEGGSNGVSYPLEYYDYNGRRVPENSIYYSIFDKKVYTKSEFIKKNKAEE